MGHGQNECTVCGKRFDNRHSREECEAVLAAQSEDGVRAIFPVIKALFARQCEAQGVPMPATYDDMTPEDRERFRAVVAMAAKGGA